jgi:hypothetical protein
MYLKYSTVLEIVLLHAEMHRSCSWPTAKRYRMYFSPHGETKNLTVGRELKNIPGVLPEILVASVLAMQVACNK